MGMLARIALRNILRHKRRTITSAITIAVGLWFFAFMDSVMAGLDRGGIDNMIELSASAVKIHTQAYQQNKEALPLDYGIDDFESLQTTLVRDSRVTGVAPRTAFLGELSNYAETAPVSGTVIDPEADSAVFNLTASLEGDYFSKDSQREIILGGELAEEMGVGPGDYITLYAVTRYDSRNADEFEVVGKLNTTDPDLNRAAVLISYQAANGFLDLEGLITEANVGLARRTNLDKMQEDAREIKQMVVKRFPSLTASSFMDMAASFLQLAKGKRAFGYVFLGVILLIAGVGIFNTVLMSVYERIREVGVLRAHGMRPRQISLMFTLEGVFTGVLGATLGVTLGALTTWAVVVYGYPVDKISGDIDISGMPYWGTIYGEWNIPALAFLFVFGVLISTLAGILPARKAGRMQITDALRFV